MTQKGHSHSFSYLHILNHFLYKFVVIFHKVDFAISFSATKFFSNITSSPALNSILPKISPCFIGACIFSFITTFCVIFPVSPFLINTEAFSSNTTFTCCWVPLFTFTV